ncbi:MAG: PDZ domain-containing protein [Armatimonadota bacterium]
MKQFGIRSWMMWLVFAGCAAILSTGVQAQRSAPGRQVGVVLRFEQNASGQTRAVVAEVVPNSPAERAGLQRGDVLIAISGTKVDGPTAIRLLQRLASEGQPLSFVVLRDGKEITLSVDSPAGSSASSASPPPVWLGVVLGEVAPGWGIKGVLVNDVIPGSPADHAGIIPGDIITHINDTPIDGVSKLQQTVRHMSPGQACVVHLQRGSRRMQRTAVVRAPSDLQPPARRLGAINVLKYALIDPQSGEVVFVGTYDPSLPGGPIPYDDILRDALDSPYPSFSLEPTPQTHQTIERAQKMVGADIERMHNDHQYGVQWANRFMSVILNDPRAREDWQRLAQKLGDAFGITPQEAQVILAAAMDQPVNKQQHLQVVAKVMRNIGWTEIADFLQNDDPNDAARKLFQNLGIWEQASKVIAAHNAGQLAETEALKELDALLYPALMRRAGVPEDEVNRILQQFRNGRISSQELNAITMQKLSRVVSARFAEKIMHGFTLTPQALALLYNLPVPRVKPTFNGLNPQGTLGKIFYEADYFLKTLCSNPDVRGRVPSHLTEHEYYLREAQRSGIRIRGGMGAEVGHQLQPAEVKMRVSPDGTVVAFDSANVRIIGWLKRFVGKDREAENVMKGWIDGYARYLTERYDDYARVIPEFHRLREAAKVVALVRWARSAGRKLVPFSPLGLRFNPPQEIDGFWTAVFEVDASSAGLYIVYEGGTEFGKEVGDGWVQPSPSVEITRSVTQQLAASAVFSSQAAEAAGQGDLETARDLAERAARAMTGEIDWTTLPDLQGNIPATPSPVAHAGAILQALHSIDESTQAVRAAQTALQTAEEATGLSEAERQRIREQAEKLKASAQSRVEDVKQALERLAKGQANPREVVVTLREAEPIFIPPAIAHLTATAPTAGTKPAPQTTQTTSTSPQPQQVDEATMKAKWRADLAELETQIARTTEQLRRLTREMQGMPALFEEWQQMAEEGMEECVKASANLMIDTATMGLEKHYKDLYEKAEKSGTTPQEVLERLKRTRKLLEYFGNARTFADIVDLITREKQTLAEILEAVRDGIGLVLDFTPVKDHPAAIAWKFGSNAVDLVHSFATGYQAWKGINQLDHTTEVYLQQVQELSNRLKGLMERAKALRARLEE